MGITVRLATKDDAALIADLSRQTFYESYHLQNTKEDMDKFLGEVFTKENLMAEVGAGGNTFFIAFNGDEALGYVRLRESKIHTALGDANAIEIPRIYALQSAIGKGVGKQLMLAAINFAKLLNKQVIWLGVWENNQRAIDFYTKFGFEKFGEDEFVLGNDIQTDWLLKKEI